MNLVITLEHRFDRTPDGAVWTQTQFARPFWSRYLQVFDQVRVVARIRDVPAAQPDWWRADGAGVAFAAVPHYIGPWQYATRALAIRRAVRAAIGPADAVILRVASQIGASAEPLLRKAQRPYGVEVVEDPYDEFAPGALRNPLRPFFRWWFCRQLRRQCLQARAASYVSAYSLQQRYPPAPAAFVTSYSSIELPDAAILPMARSARPDRQTLTLVMVGSMAQWYKGFDVLIDAAAECVRNGLDLRLVLIGDGKHRAELAARDTAMFLSDRLRFLGQLPAGNAVRAVLDISDVFVLPSKTEGVPRAMIEAMARGLPCIGTSIGGIPELLCADDMVPVSDVAALARKIRDVVTDPTRMAQMSARNLERSRAYSDDVLTARRTAFYRYIHAQTEAWLQR